MKLLVIDDSPTDREMIAGKLQSELQAEIVQVGQRDEFEAAVREGGFDLVLTDCQMAWGDGLWVLRQVQEHLPGVPVIMVAESDGDASAVDGMKEGLSDYVLKRQIEELPAAVNRSVEEKKLHCQEEGAARQLQLMEERYRVIAELTADLAFSYLVGPDGSVALEWVSRDTEPITGYDPAELDPRTGWQKLLHPDDRELASQLLARLLANEPVEARLRIVTREGETRWEEVVARPVWEEEAGRVTRAYVGAHDITDLVRAAEGSEARVAERTAKLEAQVAERTRAEDEAARMLAEAQATALSLEEANEQLARHVDEAKALSEQLSESNEQLVTANRALETQHRLYQDLFQSAPDGYLVTNEIGMIQESNQAASEMLGVDPHFLAGKWIGIFLHEPEGAVKERLATLGATAKPQRWESYLHPRGRAPVPVILYVAPGYDAQGELSSLRWMIHNIIESKRAEQEQARLMAALEAERGQLRGVLQQMQAGVIIAEAPSGRLVLGNEQFERIWRHPFLPAERVELYGRYKAFHLDGQPYRPQEWPLARSVRAGEVVVNEKMGFERGDGSRGTMLVSSTPIRDQTGKTISAVAIFFDITEQEQTEREQEAYLQRLNTLIATSQQVLAETGVEGILQRIVDAARTLTGAHWSISGHGYQEGRFAAVAVSPFQPSSLPLTEQFRVERGGPYMEMLENGRPIRLTDRHLREYPKRQKKPDNHPELRGLLGVPMFDRSGHPDGMIMVSDKEQGEFSSEDQALLEQLGVMASLALQHIDARATAERRADELDAIFGAMADVVIIYDATGQVLRGNTAARSVYGAEVAGEQREKLIERLAIRRPDGERIGLSEMPSSRALQGETVKGERLVLTNAEGVDMTMVLSAAPLYTDGQVSGAVAVWHNVTEQEHLLEEVRRQATELEAQQARVNAIIENAPEGIVVADDKGQVVLTNPAADRLYTRPFPYATAEEPAGPAQMAYPDGTPYDPRDTPLARSATDGEVHENREMALVWPDGQRRDLLVNSAPIRDRYGQVTGAVAVYVDITERKRTEESLRQRNLDLRLLNRLGQELSATLETDQVLEGLLGALGEITAADGAMVWLRDEDRPGWLICRAAAYPETGGAPVVGTRVRPGEGVAGWVARYGESIVIPNVTRDPRFVPDVDEQAGFQTRSLLAVPLRVRDLTIGVLEIANRSSNRFSAEDVSLVETLGASAAVSLENARLHNEAKQAVAAAERSRLARELHDAVSQTLFSTSVIAESLPRLWERDRRKVWQGLKQLQELTRAALSEMRTLLLELRPTALVEADLGDLIHQLADAFASRTHVAVSLNVEGRHPLPPKVQIALYRITQEALNNIAKHAHATEVTVNLSSQADGVELRIVDNGRGFDVGDIPSDRLGLSILQERAESIGASLKIDSTIGQGTEILVTWPIYEEDERSTHA